jgi:hypothetical protein
MLVPSYSLRRLLILVTLSGVVCLVPAMATRGHLWAIAASVALAAALVLAVIGGLLFIVTRAVASASDRRGISAADTGRPASGGG